MRDWLYMEESMGFDALYNQLQLGSYYAHSLSLKQYSKSGIFHKQHKN